MSRTKTAAAAEAAAAEPIAEQAELGEAVAGELVADDAAPVAADAAPEPGAADVAAGDATAEQAAAEPAADAAHVSAQMPVRLRAAVLFAFCDAVHVGCIVSGSALEIRALTESGNVDPHPDAVAAREAAGAVHVEL